MRSETDDDASRRPRPTAEQIAKAHASGDELVRQWCCFDLSDCSHIVSSLAELGSWHVEVCENCGHTEVTCTHMTREWNPEGTLLRCATCGIDAT